MQSLPKNTIYAILIKYNCLDTLSSLKLTQNLMYYRNNLNRKNKLSCYFFILILYWYATTIMYISSYSPHCGQIEVYIVNILHLFYMGDTLNMYIKIYLNTKNI